MLRIKWNKSHHDAKHGYTYYDFFVNGSDEGTFIINRDNEIFLDFLVHDDVQYGAFILGEIASRMNLRCLTYDNAMESQNCE